MTILTTLSNQKTHIIYGVVILIVSGVAYNLFVSKPKEIIKTETKTQVVYRDVIKVQRVDHSTTTTTKKSNGDVVTIIQNDVVDNTTESKKQDTNIVSKSETVIFMSKYSVDVMYPIPFNNITNPASYNMQDVQVMGGVRIFNLPFFATIGTNGHFNQVLIGLRVEL